MKRKNDLPGTLWLAAHARCGNITWVEERTLHHSSSASQPAVARASAGFVQRSNEASCYAAPGAKLTRWEKSTIPVETFLRVVFPSAQGIGCLRRTRLIMR